MSEEEVRINPRVTAFLDALVHAPDEEFVAMPGFGTFRAKYVRRGLEREVLAVHSSGLGFTVVQPAGHVGMCPHCASRKGNICEHCSCAMCSWFRQADERASPRVSREKLQQLTLRLKTFQMGASRSDTVPALDAEI